MTETLEREIRIEAKPETVFRFLTEPDAMSQWMGDSAELEPAPGGKFLVRYDSGDTAMGEFTAVEPNDRVEFTWGWEGNEAVPPASSTVEITLTDADGDTVLRLRHSGLPDAEWTGRHAEGWDHFLPRLQDLASADVDC